MGLIAELFKVTAATLKRWKSAPGESVVVIGTGLGDQTIEAELYQPSGFMGNPPKGARGVFLPVGRGRRYGVLIATCNYQITVDVGQGEVLIYSTTPDGQTLRSQLKLDGFGNIDLNGSSKRLVTYSELNTALQSFKTAINAALATKSDGAGSPGTLTLDISGASTTTIRTGG